MDAADQTENDPNSKLARRIAEKGVGWITLNHGRGALVESLRTQFPHVPSAMVVIDNLELGRIQGQQLKTLLPGGGTVLCVRGNPFDSASRGRTQGLHQELLAGPIKIEETDGLWRPDVAESAVYKWLTSPTRRLLPLRAVACQNDEMALAARQAVTRAAVELGRPELRAVPIVGGDGLPGKGLRWVDDGKLTATVSVTLPARPAIELLARHWKTGAPLPVVTSLRPSSYPPVDRLKPETPR
jgi:ABC-type sugar transport system substrate-binding protein